VTRERRFAVEAGVASLVTGVVSILPHRLALALGRGLGRVWGALDRRHLAIAKENLARAFPEWDAARVDRTARGVYAHFAAVILDLLWLSRRSRARLLSLVECEGQEHYLAAKAAGRGILFVTGHFGHWEVNALNHAYVHEPVGVIARPLDNPALDERLTAFRRRGGNVIISKWQALSQTMRMLRAGKGVAVLIDQNVQEKDGIFVDFFGRPAATTTVAAAIALKTGCAIVPVKALLLPNGRYRLSYEPVVTWQPGGDRASDVAGLTQRLTQIIEGWVRENPDQWLWLHRRWKTQPRPASGADEAVGAA
jgi:KDO2-lipid IV(A) lauroyltransferase